MSSKPRQKVVILSTANFDAPLWTNKQHLAKGLAKYFDIYYIESWGLREPRINWKDFLRIINFVLPRKQAKTESGIIVIKPWVIPFHRFRVFRAINFLLITLFANTRLKGLQEATLWTFSPITYGLDKYFSKMVYHSVDLLETFPGTPSKLIVDAEREITRKSKLTIASSIPIQSKLEVLTGSKILLMENVADTSQFKNLKLARKPCAIFAGNLTPYKIDFEIIENLAKAGINIKLAGTMSIDGGKSEQIRKLLHNYTNIEYLGQLKLEDLNIALNLSMVGIIPYQTNSHTLGIYPMKIHEYGAAGLPVVSTKLPSLLNSSRIPGLILSDPQNFAQEVQLQIETYTQEKSQAYSRFAEEKSWENRIRSVVQILEEIVEE